MSYDNFLKNLRFERAVKRLTEIRAEQRAADIAWLEEAYNS